MTPVIRMTKKAAQAIHFRRRAIQRLGLVMNKSERHAIVQQIIDKKVKLVEKQSNRIFVYEIENIWGNFFVVYDNKRKNLVTVLL